MPIERSAMHVLLELTSTFVVSQRGDWNDGDWKRFLSRVRQAGVQLDTEGEAKLGELVELARYFANRTVIDTQRQQLGDFPLPLRPLDVILHQLHRPRELRT